MTWGHVYKRSHKRETQETQVWLCPLNGSNIHPLLFCVLLTCLFLFLCVPYKLKLAVELRLVSSHYKLTGGHNQRDIHKLFLFSWARYFLKYVLWLQSTKLLTSGPRSDSRLRWHSKTDVLSCVIDTPRYTNPLSAIQLELVSPLTKNHSVKDKLKIGNWAFVFASFV